jgi:hypothetical protein
MIKVNARSLLSFTTEQLWDKLPHSEMIVIFDDKELMTNGKEVLYSSYAWNYHRLYPETQLLSKHHIQTVLKGKRLGATTHLDLINSVLWTTYDIYKNQVEDTTKLIDDLAKLAYEITNEMYNELTYRLEEFVTSLDIIDFIGVTKHPEVVEAFKTIVPTDEGIGNVNNVILKLINTDPVVINNPLSKVMRSKLVSQGQFLQCVGPRGFLTDIDSDVFKTPIKTGYVQGIRGLYESLIETRSAAKSLIFSTDPLQQSEYFSRRQQLICVNVRNLHKGDCGSQEYLDWHVRDVQYEGITKISDGDLKTLGGKYYLDEATNTLKIVNEKDSFLIGKTIKIRSSVAGCMHPDPYGVCEVCYGETALAIPAGANLGHITCVAMTAQVGQNILSTKHFDGSSVVEGIVLKPLEKKYLSATINGSMYYLNTDLKNKKVSLIIDASTAMGLTDVNLVSNVAKLNITRVSEFDKMGILIADEHSSEMPTLNVSVNKRLASMTYNLLHHIKTHGWTVTKDNNYVIDMEGWDYTQPLLTLPMRHTNMSDHQSEIADLLEATVKEMEYRSAVIEPVAMLIELHDLVNRRLHVNISILETILYSSMIVSAANNNYSLPKPWTDKGIGVMRMLLSNRSLSATFAYENHRDNLINPSSYVNGNRMDNLFDVLAMPEIISMKI